MKFKKLFLILCLVICLFTMASVCASEVNDTAITAIDLQDNLEINEDNQVIDDDNYVGAKDSTNNASTEDNVEISAPETVENSYSDKLGITDDDLIGEELRANVIALNVSALDNALFVVDCADDFNGNVSINAGDHQLYNGSVKALIEASKLPAGNYVATALFYGDDKYGELTLNDISFTVSRVTPTIYVNVEDITYPRIAYVTVHIGNNANGTVNVTVGGKTFNGTVSDGKANVSLSGLGGGSKEVDVKFFSNDYCNNNVSASTKFAVLPNNSLIQINCSEFFHVGEDIEFTVTTINSTGDLTLCVNGVYYNKYRAQRSYEISIADKYEGQYVLSFDLAGDENYTGYSTSATVNVTKNDLTINVENIDEVIYVDQPVILKAKLSNVVKGNVTFTINGAKYTEYVDNSDVVTHVYTPVNNDTLTVIATFDGNYMYKSNVSSSKDFNVSRIDTEVYVNFLSTLIAGDDAYIYVSMNPGISGTVKLRVGDKFYDVAVVEGSGMYSVSNLAKAVLDVEVIFEGDCKYAPSTSEVKSLFVSNIPTSLSISIDKTSMSYHDFAVVSVNLNQSINAVVTVKVNGKNNTVGLVNGKGSFTLYGLNKDEYIINAVFAGDDRYNGSTSNALNLTVTGDNISSSVSISLNKDSVFVGDEVIVRVNINSTVTGVIRLNIGSNSYNVVVNKGVGIFTISDLANGTYDVQAIFDGDNEHSGNSSDVKQLEVKKIPASLSVSVDTPSVVVKDKVIIKVNSNQAVSGVIRLNIGSDSYNVVVNNGVGVFTISDLAKGIYDVRAIFDGDNKYLGNFSDVKQLEVKEIPTSLSVSIDNPSIYVGGSAVVDVVLNQAINNVVTVNVNDKDYIIGIVNGKGNLTLSGLAFGTYTVNATFAGEGEYSESSSNNVTLEVNRIKTQLTGDPITVSYNGNKDLLITLKDSNGNAVRNAKLTVDLNGIRSLNTDNNGQVKVSTNGLDPNTYVAKITFDGNSVYYQSSNDIKVTVIKATPKIDAKAKTFKVKVKTKKYEITLKGNNGNAIKNAVVSLKVKGKTFKATTDSKGKAIFKITNLKKKGTYKASITYGGNKLYNKLTVNANIKAK